MLAHSLSSIQEVFQEALKKKKFPLHLLGSSFSSRAFLVRQIAGVLKKSALKKSEEKFNFVVLCNNEEKVASFYSALHAFFLDLDLDFKVTFFPTWEKSPFSSVLPSIQTRNTRVSTLSALVENQTNMVIVSSLTAFCQRTIPPSLFIDSSITLKVNDTISSQEFLIKKLTNAGFLRVDPVEDPGTFCVRGNLIDVFPVNRRNPLRIECFGEKVESIRDFDPQSQRSLKSKLEESSSVFIPPAREVLIQEKNKSFIRMQIKACADDLGISRVMRDPLLEAIQRGEYLQQSDFWAPFAYEEKSCLWDYLYPSFSLLVPFEVRPCYFFWDDQASFKNHWNKSQKQNQEKKIVPSFKDLFPWNSTFERKIHENTCIYFDSLSFTKKGNPIEEASYHKVQIESPFTLLQGLSQSLPVLDGLEPILKQWLREGFKILFFLSTQTQLERVRFLLESRKIPCQQSLEDKAGQVSLRIGFLLEGFLWLTEKRVVFTEREIFHADAFEKKGKSPFIASHSSANQWSETQVFTDLEIGDTIVHRDHGVGQYQGIVQLNYEGVLNDFLMLEYAKKDKLYLPIYRLNLIQKYKAAGNAIILDQLGSQQFARVKEKVKKSIQNLAVNLLDLYAHRKLQTGVRFSPRDSEFREFEGQFPFDETADQIKAIDAVLSDMESGKVMDRLVCGDVGYGKTEVAMRAAFRCVSDGKQVAVLVPTTLLAQQHELTFKERFKNYPILIESLSRFKSEKQKKNLLESTIQGKVDILIGTHRLLSKDVYFHDLGLIIVDEEHRFGVEHKERLKTLKVNTHVLTLTATPIPRTLNMALSGLREVSFIQTPPVERLPIRTFIANQEDSLIQEALELELSRGGQVFYLHNHIRTIEQRKKKLHELISRAKIEIAHGQMNEKTLESVFLDFQHKKFDILLCTTIIESGLDFPSANTIIIDDADHFGLAQLYQIRGRVGRGQQRAYAYFLTSKETGLSEAAQKRLSVIQRFVELGSGFNIASHDLEMRGGGNLLGAKQSGNIAALGFDLYTEMLEEAIREIQSQPTAIKNSQCEPEINVPFSAFLSEDYIPSIHQRLSFYRRFSRIMDEKEVFQLEQELQDRFGSLPPQAQNFLWLIRIKIILKNNGIEALSVSSEKITLVSGVDNKLDPQKILALISSQPHKYQLNSQSKFTIQTQTETLGDLFFKLEGYFLDLNIISC